MAPRGRAAARSSGRALARTKGALLWGIDEPWSVEETALGGHEGAGIVTQVGPGVSTLEEGDHAALASIPACGQGVSPMCLLGSFSPYVTVHASSAIRIEQDIPLDKAALVGCGVTTGWGSSTRVADVGPGETVVVVGIGGVGINAVQGAAAAGAEHVVAVDPVAFTREQALRFGATHVFASAVEAVEGVSELTWGRMADKAVITVGHIRGEDVEQAMSLVGKGGRVVVTGMGGITDVNVTLNLSTFTTLQKDLQGAVFGGADPRAEIPRLLGMYRDGTLELDELVSTTYALEDVDQGYQDMRDGKNLRGVILSTDADR